MGHIFLFFIFPSLTIGFMCSSKELRMQPFLICFECLPMAHGVSIRVSILIFVLSFIMVVYPQGCLKLAQFIHFTMILQELLVSYCLVWNGAESLFIFYERRLYSLESGKSCTVLGIIHVRIHDLDPKYKGIILSHAGICILGILFVKMPHFH